MCCALCEINDKSVTELCSELLRCLIKYGWIFRIFYTILCNFFLVCFLIETEKKTFFFVLSNKQHLWYQGNTLAMNIYENNINLIRTLAVRYKRLRFCCFSSLILTKLWNLPWPHRLNFVYNVGTLFEQYCGRKILNDINSYQPTM